METGPILQFDWQVAEGQIISTLLGEHHAGGWWAIAICLNDDAVVLRVNEDTDEIIATYEARPVDGATWKPIDQLAEYVGKELSWCWVSRNSQGYFDMFTIALKGIDPTIAFIGIASCVSFMKLAELE